MISAFAEPIPISSSTYQTTSSGNLISVRAKISGATAIVLAGRNVVEQGVILRGDLRRFLGSTSASSKRESDGQMAIVMGRYCRIGEDSVIRPPGKMTKGWVSLRCMRDESGGLMAVDIGSSTIISSRSRIASTSGNGVLSRRYLSERASRSETTARSQACIFLCPINASNVFPLTRASSQSSGTTPSSTPDQSFHH